MEERRGDWKCIIKKLQRILLERGRGHTVDLQLLIPPYQACPSDAGHTENQHRILKPRIRTRTSRRHLYPEFIPFKHSKHIAGTHRTDDNNKPQQKKHA